MKLKKIFGISFFFLAFSISGVHNVIALDIRYIDIVQVTWPGAQSSEISLFQVEKTIEEDVKIWNSEHSRYETIEILSAEIETATLTNRSLRITMTSSGFASNIWKDRASKWNPYPKAFISSGSFGKGYATLKKCITMAEELQAEIDNAAAVKENKLSLQEKAVNSLRAQYPTAGIIAEMKWDSNYKKDVPVVRVALANGITVILEPYRENVDGSLEYSRHSISTPKVDNLVVLNALNSIPA